MADIDKLINALRCGASAYKVCECSSCVYGLKEDLDELGITEEENPLFTDMEEDGKQYYVSCDCDRMLIDAANMLTGMKDLKDKIDCELNSLDAAVNCYYREGLQKAAEIMQEVIEGGYDG